MMPLPGRSIPEGRLIPFPARQIEGGHTPGHLDCPGCASMRQNTAAPIAGSQVFKDAFAVWIANRTFTERPDRFSSARYISKRTEWDYRQCARALGKMFDLIPVSEIHIGHIREYHRARAFCDGPWQRQAGANRIRKEVAVLVRVMRAAGAWTDELEMFFQPLQREENDVQRSLDAAEQAHFLATAASSERWSFIHHYTVAALQTCCSTNELRTLRIGDVSVSHAAVTIRKEGAKNRFRRRTIPLESGEVLWAFERLVERAADLGATGPYHYLFPLMEKRHCYDPTQPMSDSGLKKRWDEVRIAAGIPWLRPYDLRHTAITRMAESGVPVAIIMSFAGHMSLKMQQHYTTISMMAKRKAIGSTWHKDGSAETPSRSGNR